MAEVAHISFTIDNHSYGLDIMNVRAVENYANISSVIGAPAYVKGVLSLRGELIPVYSIRNKFSLPNRKPDSNTKLIVVNLNELSVAMEVDAVEGIINVPMEQTTAKPGVLNSGNTDFVGHVAEINGKVILLLDLGCLITEEERSIMLEMIKKDK